MPIYGQEEKIEPGELIKVAVVTHRKGTEPDPHIHGNEEQFIHVLKGSFRMLLGDEIKVVKPGETVHIPRNTNHGIKVLEEPVVFFAAKSPVGDGRMTQDYRQAENIEELKARLLAPA